MDPHLPLQHGPPELLLYDKHCPPNPGLAGDLSGVGPLDDLRPERKGTKNLHLK